MNARRSVVDGLSPQLFIHPSIPEPGMLRPIRNREFIKPQGGLWTSTYNNEHGSDWIRYMYNSRYDLLQDRESSKPYYFTLLYPGPQTKVLTIHTINDFNWLMHFYPDGHFPDFEALTKEWDGIHLTANGQRETVLKLYGWDCESTLWFRWVFERTIVIHERGGARKVCH